MSGQTNGKAVLLQESNEGILAAVLEIKVSITLLKSIIVLEVQVCLCACLFYRGWNSVSVIFHLLPIFPYRLRP